jgi:hypothetical protein
LQEQEAVQEMEVGEALLFLGGEATAAVLTQEVLRVQVPYKEQKGLLLGINLMLVQEQ